MSVHLNKLCALVVRDLFGAIAESVVSVLCKGEKPAAQIRIPDVSPSKVKAALLALIHHNIVIYRLEGTLVLYSVHHATVLCLVRSARYLQLIREQVSETAETIVEEIINCGRSTLSHVLFRVGCRVHAADPEKLSVKQLLKEFCALRDAGYLEQCPPVVDAESYLKPTSKETVPTFGWQTVDAQVVVSSIHDRILASAENEGDQPDKYILWRVNAKRFDIQLRDSVLVDASVRRTDDFGGTMIRTMLSRVASTLPMSEDSTIGNMSYFTLKSEMGKVASKPVVDRLRDYLEALQIGSVKIVKKLDDTGGGLYAVSVKSAIDSLTAYAVRKIVRERFGTKAARVFSLILDKTFVDQEQIQETALIPTKEAKIITYLLVENHFASVREIRKSVTGAGAGTKSVYLFHVDLQQVVRGLVDGCYKSLSNIVARKEAEVSDHERLLEKQARVDAILKTLTEQGADAEQLEGVASLITPPEQDIVVRVNYLLDRLSAAEMEVESTLSLFEWYILYDVIEKKRLALKKAKAGRRTKT